MSRRTTSPAPVRRPVPADAPVTRRRIAAFVVVIVLAAAAVAVAVAHGISTEQERRRPTAQTTRDTALDLRRVRREPHIVFRSTALGPTYGLAAAVPLADPLGERAVSATACDRVYATAQNAVCLSADRGAVTTYSANLLDEDLVVTGELALGGIPSRARTSIDGSLAATTAFVTGHSYLDKGFSTETLVHDLTSGIEYGNIEKTFTTVIDGETVTAADLNAWGVTFVPGDRPTRFYATVATGGRTWLAEGDLRSRTLTAIHEDGECPSVSPDGTTIVFKLRRSPTVWNLQAYDVATGRTWALAETRSVDDQVEWLDEANVLYGLPRAGSAETDVWKIPLTGGAPELFVPNAWSPSVVRSTA